jgi:hypothetical protein
MNGEWQAEVVISDCAQVNEGDVLAYEKLKLIQVRDGTEMIVDSQLENPISSVLICPNSNRTSYSNPICLLLAGSFGIAQTKYGCLTRPAGNGPTILVRKNSSQAPNPDEPEPKKI